MAAVSEAAVSEAAEEEEEAAPHSPSLQTHRTLHRRPAAVPTPTLLPARGRPVHSSSQVAHRVNGIEMTFASFLIRERVQWPQLKPFYIKMTWMTEKQTTKVVLFLNDIIFFYFLLTRDLDIPQYERE